MCSYTGKFGDVQFRLYCVDSSSWSFFGRKQFIIQKFGTFQIKKPTFVGQARSFETSMFLSERLINLAAKLQILAN